MRAEHRNLHDPPFARCATTCTSTTRRRRRPTGIARARRARVAAPDVAAPATRHQADRSRRDLPAKRDSVGSRPSPVATLVAGVTLASVTLAWPRGPARRSVGQRSAGRRQRAFSNACRRIVQPQRFRGVASEGSIRTHAAEFSTSTFRGPVWLAPAGTPLGRSGGRSRAGHAAPAHASSRPAQPFARAASGAWLRARGATRGRRRGCLASRAWP